MIGGLHNLILSIRFSNVSAEPSGTSAHGEGIDCRTPMKMAPVRILHMKKWRKGFLECSRTSCKKRQQRRMGCKRGTMNKWKKGKKGPTKEARPPNKGRCWVSPSLRFSSAFSLFLYFLLFIRFFFFSPFLFLAFFWKYEVVATDAGPPTHFYPYMFQFSTSFSIVSHFSSSRYLLPFCDRSLERFHEFQELKNQRNVTNPRKRHNFKEILIGRSP